MLRSTALVVTFVLAAPLIAQDAKPKEDVAFSLENIFPDKKKPLFGPSAQGAAFAHDGKHAAYLYRPLDERRHGSDLWIVDVADGAAQTLALPGLVSRKKDFVPALTKAVKDGWVPPEAVVQEHVRAQVTKQAEKAEESPSGTPGGMKRSRSMKDVAKGDVVVDYSDEPSGKLVRIAS